MDSEGSCLAGWTFMDSLPGPCECGYAQDSLQGKALARGFAETGEVPNVPALIGGHITRYGTRGSATLRRTLPSDTLSLALTRVRIPTPDGALAQVREGELQASA